MIADQKVSVFVHKFSPTGAPIIRGTFVGSSGEASPYDVAVAPNGEVVVAGQYNGSLDLGGGKSLTADTSRVSGFVLALNADDLSVSRAFTLEGGSSAVASIDVTGTGAYRIAGQVADGCTIGGITIGDTTVHASANGSPFVAELAASTGQAAGGR